MTLTREEVLRLAREFADSARTNLLGVTLVEFLDDESDSSLHRFANDIYAKGIAEGERRERGKVAEFIMQKGYATGHGDTTEDLLSELTWQTRESEREACIIEAEGLEPECCNRPGPECCGSPNPRQRTVGEIAEAIRARGEGW